MGQGRALLVHCGAGVSQEEAAFLTQLAWDESAYQLQISPGWGGVLR